jgi:ATP-binding cassette subfamily C protein LapB
MTGVSQLLGRLEEAVRSFNPTGSKLVGSSSTDQLALALCDVARHYGTPATPAALVSGLPLVGGRLPLEYVEAAARRAGLTAQFDRFDLLNLANFEMPAFVLTRDGGLDVIWSIERDGSGRAITVTSSEPGRPNVPVRIKAEELAAAASGRIVRLRPSSQQDERSAGLLKRRAQRWFLPAFAASKRIYTEAIAATVAINILALAMPLFTMNVYDRVLPNAAADTMWSLAIGVVLATMFDFLIRSLRGRFVDVAGRRADVVLSNLVYARLLGARQEGAAASTGVRSNTLRELDTLRDFFNSATLTAFGDLPFLFMFIAMIWLVAGSLVLIPLAAIPIVLAIGWVTQRSIARLMEASVRQSAMKNAVVVETLAGLDSIKAAGAESWAASMWEKATAENIRTSTELKHYSNIGLHTVHAAQTLTQVIMIVAGFYMAAEGLLTTGALIAATMLAGRAMQPLAQMASLLARLHQTRLSYRLLDEIVTAPQERPDDAVFVAKATFAGAIAFEGVAFRYEKDAAPVLDDISFSISQGERVGLVGGIGTGKSTLLKLIHALHVPSGGRVLIDGIPASHIDPAVLRSQVGLTLQQADLFHGTIRSNITLSDPGVDDEGLLEAARVAGALDWIIRLPKGLETIVRERGAGLSGGQRQTIVLARALLRKPRVLLLDEPTSDLDPLTEQIVVERLRLWLDGRTAVIVTHRPAMLALVHRLIVLEGCRKRFDGPKASVLAALTASVAATSQANTQQGQSS